MTGLYIAIEGIDGTGKSTQASRLAEHYDSILVAEPGSTHLAQTLRQIVKDPSVSMGVEAEALLFAAARADLLHTVVDPAISGYSDQIVISDRSVYSSLAYQGFREGKDLLLDVWNANRWATKNHSLLPDLVLQIDLDAETAFSRRSSRPDDRMEATTRTEDLIDGFNRVRQGIHSTLNAWKTTWVKIDGLGTPDEVFEEMVEAVEKYRSTTRSPSPQYLTGPGAYRRAMVFEASHFATASDIAVGVSDEGRGKGAARKSHYYRKNDGLGEARWISLCRGSKPTKIKVDCSDDPQVTCTRCLLHSDGVRSLDFSRSVDSSDDTL